MRSARKLAATALAGTLLATALGVAGAGAQEVQNITGTLDGTITLGAAPADHALAALPATAEAVGSISVSANTAYKLQVASKHAVMTEWTGTDFGTKTLSSAMTMTAVNPTTTTGGVGAVATVGTAPATLATNPFTITGLLSTTDTYDLTVTQPATALDPAGTYRHELTYTVSAGV